MASDDTNIQQVSGDQNEIAPAEQDEPSTPAAENKRQKLNEFDLFDFVIQHSQFFKVDSCLFMRTFSGTWNIDKVTKKKELEPLLLKYYFHQIHENYNMSNIKNCASLLWNMPVCNYVAADKCNTLCLENGYINLYDLQQATFLPYNLHHPELPYRTYTLPVNGSSSLANWAWNRNISSPQMDNFLCQVTNGDDVLIQRIWEMLGYLLTPTNEKICFLLQGVPNSGKSVLGQLIRSFYPAAQIQNLDIDQLGKSTASSQLINKSINLSMDLPNQVLPVSAVRVIKMISGGDDITVHFSNGSYQSCNLNCRFLFATNHPLILKGRDDAFENRIVCIPFRNGIPRGAQDPYLLQKILYEREYILSKALGYYEQLVRHNFVFSGSENSRYAPQINYVPNAGEEVRDHIIEFVDEQCQFVDQNQGYTFTDDLYQAYFAFCRDKGYTPVNDKGAFSRTLHQYFKDKITKKKIRDHDKTSNGYYGIVLNSKVTLSSYTRTMTI